MESCIIRFASLDDYEAVENIMEQVQNLHVEWRPDIYKPCEVVLSSEEFVMAIQEETYLWLNTRARLLACLRLCIDM